VKLYVGRISTDIVGSDVSFEFEIEDNATEDEIHEAAKESAYEHIEFSYEEVGKS